MDIDTCIRRRKSTRRLRGRMPEKADIESVLFAATMAPSPKNRQPWHFMVLSGEPKNLLSRAYRDALDMYGEHGIFLPGEKSSELATADAIDSAPVLILIFNRYPSDRSGSHGIALPDIANIQSIGAAIQNMILKATSMGMASLWICDLLAAKESIESACGGSGELIAGVLLGYPAAEPVSKRTAREPVDEVAVWVDQHE